MLLKFTRVVGLLVIGGLFGALLSVQLDILAQDDGKPADEAAPEYRFRLYPPLTGFLTCIDHWEGQLSELGDALGKDCFTQKMINRGGRIWLGAYKRDGYRNEDWYTYQAEVHAPISGVVKTVSRSAGKNSPGSMGEGLASKIVIVRDDGFHVVLAHLERIDVKEREQVTRGQVVGNVGNNGFSRHPHLHIGAWRNNKPLPIDFDLSEMAYLNEESETTSAD